MKFSISWDSETTNTTDMSTFPKICVIGAGVSGICMGVGLAKEGLTNYTIFDENDEVGGTWLRNTYPGCACDIPTHLYSFSFHPNPNWSSFFSSQPEILEYMKDVAQTHDLYKKIKFHNQVIRLTWDGIKHKWRVLVKDQKINSQEEILFDIIIGAVGGLRVPNIPQQFESFKGPTIHSALWNSSIKLENKRVGVVGSGASAVQIIPEIAKTVKQLVVFQRHPAWVVPRMQFEYPSWLKWMFENVPGARKVHRATIFMIYEMSRPVYTANSMANKLFTKLGSAYLQNQVGQNPSLREKLTPNYMIGCKRMTPSDYYYSSLKLPNVKVTRSEITEVRGHSIVTKDGQEESLDVLILATGFRVQDYFAPLEITGKDGINIMEEWKTNGPSTYLGIVTSVIPNGFFVLGPNAAPGNNSAIFSVECQVNWSIGVIQEMVRRKAKVVSVKEEIEKAHMEQVLEDLKSTVWASPCGAWYTDHRGVVTALNPSNGMTYWNQTRNPDFSKLSFG